MLYQKLKAFKHISNILQGPYNWITLNYKLLSRLSVIIVFMSPNVLSYSPTTNECVLVRPVFNLVILQLKFPLADVG